MILYYGTSIFFLQPGKVVVETGKEGFLRRTLAYGSQYGIWVFCLTEAGEHQIGWVPEKDQAITVGKACDLLNFHARIDSISAKKWETS